MTAPSTTAVQLPAAGTYRIDPTTSTIAFNSKHMFGLGTVKGSFSVTSGEIVVAETPSGTRVTASASSQSFASANPKRDAQVKSETFLHADAFPLITFRSTTFVRKGDQWVLRGEITARGNTAPAEFTLLQSRADAAGLTLQATGTVDRYAHQITKMKGMAGRFLNLEISIRATRS